MAQRPASVGIAHWRWCIPWVGAAALALTACGDIAKLPVAAGTGAQPTLPPPQPTLMPTVNIAPAKGWPPGTMPQAAADLQVTAFANGLDHPRWLLTLPNGDVLVAETNAPPRPDDGQGIKGWVAETGRAAIWVVDIATGAHRLFASGLRNPNGLAWEPTRGAVWTVVNERDEIGSDLVPDNLTSVRDGAFYGWPYSYYGQHLDARVTPPRPDLVARAIAPDYALGPHTASLGLASSAGTTLPARFANGMFIGQHGSWNRRPHSGYKVIFVPFENGKPSGVRVLSASLHEFRTRVG